MKKNRSILKEYFKKGAIPTDSNFADLIDSMLNQEEDNISKLPNDPLKIIATGTDEALLNFYRLEQSEAKLSWQVKQKPGGNAGLSIGDDVGSRLFVQSSTGYVGIGTTTPGAKLEVSNTAAGRLGGILRISNPAGGTGTQAALEFTTYNVGANAPGARILATDNGNASADFDFQTKNPGAQTYPLTTRLKITADGNVGIGTTSAPAGRLEVVGLAAINDGNGYAVKNRFMASGSLTIGSITQNYGGGTNSWNTNTAGLLLETLKNTEIAVHDAGMRVASLMYYEGDNSNRITIGRDMGWGAIGSLILSGNVIVKNNGGGAQLQLDGSQKILFSDSDTSNNLKIQLWSGYGLGINSGTLFYASNSLHSWRDGNGANERMRLTTTADGALAVFGTGTSSFAGNLLVGGSLMLKQPVYFSAYVELNSRTGNLNPLPMKVTSQNVGGGFDTGTSQFTAPVKGVYLFTMTAYKAADETSLQWYMRLNNGYVNSGGTASDEYTERGLMTLNATGTSASRTVILSLSAGDRVYVEQVGTGRVDNFRSGLEGVLLFGL